MEVLHPQTQTHGRVLIEAPSDPPRLTLVGFHGYAQSAEDMLDVLKRIPGSGNCRLVAIQALNRFYTRGDQKIVASWMTRQDRDLAIADNIAYADRALNNIENDIIFLGFSQGVAMAYRAAVLGKRRAAGVIAIAGDVPPDVKDVPADRWPRVLVAAGAKDHWYTPEKVAADEAFLRNHGVVHDIHRNDAGHDVTDDILDAAARFIARA